MRYGASGSGSDFDKLKALTSGAAGAAAPAAGPKAKAGTNDAIYGVDDAAASVPIVWKKSGIDLTSGSSVFSDRLGAASTSYRSDPAETRTYLSAQKEFYQFDPNDLTAVQSALVNSGFLTDKKWTAFGEQDDTSFKAWKAALTRSARTGKSIWETLGLQEQGELRSQGQALFDSALSRVKQNLAEAAPKGPAPLQVRYSNPDDLKVIASKAASDILGSVPDGAFMDSFVQIYQQMERKTQQAAYRTNLSGGSFTAPADPSVVAAKELRAKYATQATGQSVAKTFESFLSVIGAQR